MNVKQTPWMTVTMIGLCVATFLFVNATPVDAFRQLGALGIANEYHLYQGRYFGLVGSAFVHREPLHLAFNMFWLWGLGGLMEREFGPWRFLGFVVISAFVSSGIQLILGTTGIGFSGVGYAMFAFCYITRGIYRTFDIIASDANAKVMAGWGLLCIVLTYTHTWNVANGAHIGGAAFGIVVGGAIAYPKDRIVFQAVCALIIAGSCVPLFWNPNSATWVGMAAVNADLAGDVARAEPLYSRYISLGGDKEWAYRNLAYAYLRSKRTQDLQRMMEKLKSEDIDVYESISSELKAR